MKPIEKLLRGGSDTASVTVVAEVCQRCGERMYSPETVREFENIRATLENRETRDFTQMGKSFQVRLAG